MITKEQIKALSQQIEDYKEGLENEQDRNYGDLNFKIKLYSVNFPIDEIKTLYPKATDDMIYQLYWEMSGDYVRMEVNDIKDKYGWEAGVEGRSGGWLYVNGVMHDLQVLIDELDNLFYDADGSNNKYIATEYKGIVNKFKKIQNNIVDIENSVKQMIQDFTDSVESIDTWKGMGGLL